MNNMFRNWVAALVLILATDTLAFFPHAGMARWQTMSLTTTQFPTFMMSPNDEKISTQDEGVLELSDDEPVLDMKKKTVAPFLSQGEGLAEGVLNPDFSDPKQTRVVLYIILSLLPVLFLIPFMISREFIPADMLPPVEMN